LEFVDKCTGWFYGNREVLGDTKEVFFFVIICKKYLNLNFLERRELSTQASGAVSAIYTWQDNRCTPAFLASLPQPESHIGLSSGFGIPTLFWMAKNKPERLEKYDRAGTVMVSFV